MGHRRHQKGISFQNHCVQRRRLGRSLWLHLPREHERRNQNWVGPPGETLLRSLVRGNTFALTACRGVCVSNAGDNRSRSPASLRRWQLMITRIEHWRIGRIMGQTRRLAVLCLVAGATLPVFSQSPTPHELTNPEDIWYDGGNIELTASRKAIEWNGFSGVRTNVYSAHYKEK